MKNQEKDKKCKGIYCWINKINNKRYIGQAGGKGGFWARWRQEIYRLNHNTQNGGLNKHFLNAWNKYGEENFKPLILEILENPTKQQLVEREQYWCDFYKSNDRKFGYNKRKCVESNSGCEMPKGENSYLSKLTEKEILEIRQKYSMGNYTYKILGEEYGVSTGAILGIIHNKNWKDPYYIPQNKGVYKLTKKQVLEIRIKYDGIKYTYKKLAEEYNIDISTVASIMELRTWKEKDTIPPEFKNTSRITRGERNSFVKLTEKDVLEIREKHSNGTSKKDLILQFSVSRRTIERIIQHKIWKHI